MEAVIVLLLVGLVIGTVGGCIWGKIKHALHRNGG